MKYAIIKESVVENIIVWDGESAYNPGPGYELVEASDGCDIGMIYKDGKFIKE